MSGTMDRTVTVDGVTLYTRRRPGTAQPPLLLLHGIGGSLDSWTPLLDALPDRYLIMIDSPGAGRSAVPALPLRLPRTADVIAAAVRELGFEQVDLLGFSLGGTTAQELAHRHPTLVRRLMLVATINGYRARIGGWKVRRTLLSTRRYRDPAAAARDLPVLAGGRTTRDPEILASIVAERAPHAPTWRGYRFQQLAMIGWSSHRWLSQLRVPTLVLNGTDDPVVLPVNARTLADAIPGAHAEIVPGAGHMLLFDDTATTAPIIERFLA